MRLLFVSTPVGALGTGIGGGVELTLATVARELQQRGHCIRVIAPAGSKLTDIPLLEIAGNVQIPAQTQRRDTPISLPENSLLATMWECVRQVQNDWDLVVNFAFDWLPFYLTPFLHCRVAHFISMGSMSNALDRVMSDVARDLPNAIGVYTQAQADTFPFGDRCRILGSGIDLSNYQFCPHPEPNRLAWLGRISPEKALEDAVAAVRETGRTLAIYGKIQDEAYWQQIRATYPDAAIEYGGFLTTSELQAAVGKCQALLMTPRWVEAFGIVAIEALACGVPTIAYRRGGPAEIVRHGETGFLVEPDSIAGLVAAIARIEEINRQTCRQAAEQHYSLAALGDRFEAWFQSLVETSA